MWNKLEHAYKLQIDAQENPLELCYISEVFRKHYYDKLFIAYETIKKVQNNIHLNNYKYIVKPQCIKNSVSETMIDFFNFTNFLVTTIVQEKINQYYNHLIDLKYSDYRSSQFKNNLIENFGCYTDSSNKPYVTANTTFTHCLEHQKCVQELIQGLQPLFDAVNNYFDVTYPVLYAKMKKLDLGPNVPKSFGAFPTVSINFNCISQFHKDLKDHHNILCVVCPLGIFKGTHLVFPELKLANNLIENFGCYTDSSNKPYVTANTTFTHCLEHQKCVQELIQGLQPLFDAVNNYFDVTYPVLYAKMKKLDLGPNVPKSFGAFPTVSINFNCISQFHKDLKDHHNILCVVCPLGIFKGTHLVFPELKLAVEIKQGQAIAFRSNLLIHENLPVIGTRHSVVFYIHNSTIKQKQKFKSLFSDGDLDSSEILDTTLSTKKSKKNNPNLNPRNFLDLKNNRKNYLNMKLPLKGSPAKYKSED
ncbi:hypothetical protein Glove_253g25 [Diversispora epigaea]|uniref:2OGFeDO JBP1/TET oxygenase domain-containing protein n=1 Tax=Diversispora epigaea TaxID=1348612 RepID=A0A397IGF5_9GLOM|nr:hypothetical protein Glove_253g25 [Diversispora epigaea]